MFEFLTYGLNFSLFLRGHANFSLLVWISHLYGANTRISHFYVWISHFWSLFQWNSHFSSLRHSHAGRPTPMPAGLLPRRPALYHAGPPNDMVNTMSLTGWRAPAGHCMTCWRAKSEKFKHKSEKFACPRRKSEKFKPQVRNWNIKVRNSRLHAGKVRNSNQKWKICTSTQEKWEIQTISENWNIFLCVLVRNLRVKWNLG